MSSRTRFPAKPGAKSTLKRKFLQHCKHQNRAFGKPRARRPNASFPKQQAGLYTRAWLILSCINAFLRHRRLSALQGPAALARASNSGGLRTRTSYGTLIASDLRTLGCSDAFRKDLQTPLSGAFANF